MTEPVPMTDAPISTLPAGPLPVGALASVGPVTRGWLLEAGIRTVEDLRAAGSLEAYRRIKFMFPRRVSLNALYALEAALRGCPGADLPPDVTAALRREAGAIDEALRRGASARCSL
jgi:DNA transformation protein